MFIQREIKPKLLDYATKFPVVAVLGPRQSGKTTLSQEAFPKHAYFSLEDPDTKATIIQNPRIFLEADYGAGIILDEFQLEPQLLSYIQGIVDRNFRPGYFILTGSQNFLMNQVITQSLAGRVGILTLLPLSCNELAQANQLDDDLIDSLLNGGYPSIYVRSISSNEFAANYVTTYLERDVPQLTNIIHLRDFQRFMQLCAGRIGQILPVQSLANDCNISVETAEEWLSTLEASYIIFFLSPHFNNFNKRLTKEPKLYFYDTGLACHLLRIVTNNQLRTHPARGALFESLIIADIAKHFYKKGSRPSLYCWRTTESNESNEINCIIDYGTLLVPIEIKSSSTYNNRFIDGIKYSKKQKELTIHDGFVVYGGSTKISSDEATILSWKEIKPLLETIKI